MSQGSPEDPEASTRAAGRRLLVAQVRSQVKGVGFGMLLGVLWTTGKIIIPLLVRTAYDEGVVGDDEGALVTGALLVVGIGLASALCAGGRRWNAFREARLAEASLRERLFAHLQGLHFGYHDLAHTGDLMSRANTDVQSIQQLFSTLPITAANLMTIVGATTIMFVIDPVLAALALISLPGVHVVGKRFSEKLHPEVLGIQQESAQLATVVEEAISGVRVIKGFGAEPVLERRLRDEADDVYDVSLRAARIRSVYAPALELLPNIGLVTVLLVGGHRVLDGVMTIGDLLSFNIYLALLIGPLRMLGTLVAQTQRAVAAAGRIDEVLAADPAVIDQPHAVPLRPGTGEIRFEGVRFGYGQGPPVLDGVDLVIEGGTSIALVGATGSGKTTVARLVPRFYDLDAGRILIDGQDVQDVRLHDLRSAVATVFEETFLFSDSIGANIAFAQPDADNDAIERAARLAGAAEFIGETEDGYSTVVGERGFSLSGGQRQRIAIARAVLADPRVLILDDATSAVDPTKEHEIRDSLAEVMRGRTTIVIAHRPATVALADRVVLLDGGRIVADGTHQSLLVGSARYREVLAAAEAQDEELLATSGSVTGGPGSEDAA